MSKFFAFNPTTNQRTLRLVDQFSVADLQTDYPICVPGGRLALSSSNYAADATDATACYYLPCSHNLIPIWDGSYWQYYEVPNAGITMPSLTGFTGAVYDYFAEIQSGVMQMDYLAWSTNTARTSALTRRNGIAVLNSNNSMTYLGTVRTTGSAGSAKYQDSDTQRFVWNEHNQIMRTVRKLESAGSWTYNSGTWRPFNNSTANIVEWVDGLGIGVMDLTVSGRTNTPSGTYGQFGIAVDNTTTPSDGFVVAGGNAIDTSLERQSFFKAGAGYHYAHPIESVGVGGTATFFSGSTNGLRGVWLC